MIAEEHADHDDHHRTIKTKQAADKFPVKSAVCGDKILGQSAHVRLLMDERKARINCTRWEACDRLHTPEIVIRRPIPIEILRRPGPIMAMICRTHRIRKSSGDARDQLERP